MSMLRGKTEAETLRLNGWGVGTRLIGTEGGGERSWWAETIIEVTYLTRTGGMLARTIAHRSSTGKHDREVASEEERSWTLGCRNWSEVPPAKRCPRCGCDMSEHAKFVGQYADDVCAECDAALAKELDEPTTPPAREEARSGLGQEGTS